MPWPDISPGLANIDKTLIDARGLYKVGDEILRLRGEIGLDYLLCAPLSHQSFMLLTEKVLPRIM